MSGYFHLFVYGTLRSNRAGAALLADGQLIGTGSVGGVLYSIDGAYPALVLYGDSPVAGEVWRCPAATLWSLDEYEAVDSGLFRRIGVNVKLADGTKRGCWTYVAGPKLSQKLVPSRRIEQWA
ncbi:MAG TPA: gamma-glutamylcyclotransferase family protein [Longimicrobiales bacterium]|nr:gamma-glutamylcyclotransferase family protein [Longimicrobiales bacterium]